MFKRLFFAMLGLGGGIALGVAGMRKLERTQKALAPSALAGSLGARVSGAIAAGREAMALTEAQLRAEHGLADPSRGTHPGASLLPPD
jgi:hypothetical protein